MKLQDLYGSRKVQLNPEQPYEGVFIESDVECFLIPRSPVLTDASLLKESFTCPVTLVLY